jgi:hypothetical protein
MKNFKFKIKDSNRGYTIIETMISVSLFLIIITSGMTALVNANSLHQKSQDIRSIMDNLSFIMEDMSRNLRLGRGYHCGDSVSIESPKSCTSAGIIYFEESLAGVSGNASDQWGYKVESIDGTNFNISKTEDGGASWFQLNPPEVKLKSFSGFAVLGAEAPSGNSQQPFVTIRLIGTITTKNIVTPFSLQSSVSQRVLDI